MPDLPLCEVCHRPLPELAAPAGVVDDGGWLVPPAQRELTPHRYKQGNALVEPLRLGVVHYTASPRGRGPAGSNERRIRRWLLLPPAPGRGASSTHFVILRDGRVIQAAPLTDRTWHCVPDREGYEGANSYAFGLDFEHVGWLVRQGDGTFRDSYGNVYTGPAPVRAGGRWWEPFSAAPVASALALLQEIGGRYPGLKLVGHEEIQSNRVDPGPAVPMEELRAALAGGAA